MSDVALARKYRPRTFAELIGQNHVTKALTNSLSRQRLHHAYLFTGTRGVGKTSIARLFAKALNCETGITPTPCLTCDTCLGIEQARYIDLIEIDAASKTRVEDTRELLDNVIYSPTQGRFKVYLIDEVHMLSTHSFNALLKTLEEPPAHVVFLLATTEAQKLPMTILSRCLQFHLNALPPELIKEQLNLIIKNEKIVCEAQALELVAHAADGSVRDALSLLDQIIALSDDAIQVTDVKKMLGHTTHDHAIGILNALAHNQPEKLLQLSQHIATDGGQYTYVLNEILCYLHQICLLQIIPQSTDLTPLSQALSPEDTQLLYQIALKGQEELPLAPTPAIGFEMTLLRMHTFKPANLQPSPPSAYEAVPKKNTPATEHQAIKSTTKPAIKSEPINPSPKAATPPQSDDNWEALIPKLNLTGLALNAAKQAELVLEDSNIAHLHFDKNHRSLFTPGVIKKIEDKLSEYYGTPIQLKSQSNTHKPNSPAEKQRVQDKIIHDEHQATLNTDPAFQALKNTFL
ncbi:MAG: DNA polymerase III subunit gamma/tau [Gammaproteobacteria bacterium]|nr:DNA polymerase III subunit gamma/tau [Gammaproteobacteria bacterium]MCH9716044.1 DNA polymerase III subunit gamma/tau [Gammaproteobacteria bacterium]MCH9763487.1 DNA polymerase III subunit gamma/tau [Gammaproteobacteria bacterium]